MSDLINGLFMAVVVILLIVGVYWLGFWLWGLIAVAKFGLPILTLWEYLGMSVLLSLLFGSYRYTK